MAAAKRLMLSFRQRRSWEWTLTTRQMGKDRIACLLANQPITTSPFAHACCLLLHATMDC